MNRWVVGIAGLLVFGFAPDGVAGAACPVWSTTQVAEPFGIGWYPYAEKLLIQVPRATLSTNGEAEITVLVRESENELAVPLGETSLALAGSAPSAEGWISLPSLAPGRYEVVLSLTASPGCSSASGPVRSFVHDRFGWEHNDLGITDQVIPPFTALEVEGRRVASVLREHELGDLGLWRQVESLGRPLLAGPIRLELDADGGVLPIQVTRPLSLEQTGPGRVVGSAAWKAGSLFGRVTTRFEMDGLARIVLEIDGDTATRLTRFDLVIPIRAEIARFLNAIGDRAFRHRLGEIPYDQGVAWNSKAAGGLELPPGFAPYVWIGDERRGLSWLAETTRDWWIAPAGVTQSLARIGDVVELRIRLVTKPGRLDRKRHIAFALQATPVKPRPQDWRRWYLSCDPPADTFHICPLPAAYYWGAESPYGHVYPRNRDESVLTMLAAARRGDKPGRKRITDWLDDHDVRGKGRERSLSSVLFSANKLALKPDAVIAYINAHKSNWTPEFSVYADEWHARPFSDRAGRDANAQGEIDLVPVKSFQDFVLWHLDRLLSSNAVDGFFFDNTFLRAWFDPRFGTAWRPDGEAIRPGVDLLELRELLMRAQILVWQRRGRWLNLAHMTSTPIAAVHGWAGISLDGEWKYGLDDFQDRFPRSLIRAASLGSALGTVPVYLPGIRGETTRERRKQLERSLAGVTALHEIRVMARAEGPLRQIWQTLLKAGYTSADCHVGRYWDDPPPVRLRGGDAEALLVSCEGRALALVVSWGASGSVELELRHPLGDGHERVDVRCKDLESKDRLEPLSDAVGCRVPIDRHDFRLIEITGP